MRAKTSKTELDNWRILWRVCAAYGKRRGIEKWTKEAAGNKSK